MSMIVTDDTPYDNNLPTYTKIDTIDYVQFLKEKKVNISVYILCIQIKSSVIKIEHNK